MAPATQPVAAAHGAAKSPTTAASPITPLAKPAPPTVADAKTAAAQVAAKGKSVTATPGVVLPPSPMQDLAQNMHWLQVLKGTRLGHDMLERVCDRHAAAEPGTHATARPHRSSWFADAAHWLWLGATVHHHDGGRRSHAGVAAAVTRYLGVASQV